jgi:hypothetical protein
MPKRLGSDDDLPALVHDWTIRSVSESRLGGARIAIGWIVLALRPAMPWTLPRQ